MTDQGGNLIFSVKLLLMTTEAEALSIIEKTPPILAVDLGELKGKPLIPHDLKGHDIKILPKRKSNPPSRSVSPSNQDAGMLFKVSKNSGIESISVGEISSGTSSRNESLVDVIPLSSCFSSISSSPVIEIPSSTKDYGFALATKAAVEGEKLWSSSGVGLQSSSTATAFSEQEFSFDADREDGIGQPLEYVRKTTSSISQHHLISKKTKRKYRRRDENGSVVGEDGADEFGEEFISDKRRRNVQRSSRRTNSSSSRDYFEDIGADDEDGRGDDEEDGGDGDDGGDGIINYEEDKYERLKKRRGAKGIDKNNRVCISCQTTKTPYWRESWSAKVSLCNACGLRWGKFRHRCSQCCYVPRKEDKGTRSCSRCGGSWA